MGYFEHGDSIELDPCPRCGVAQWTVWVSLSGPYFTAYAECKRCDGLYFTRGDDVSKENALASLKTLVCSGIYPYC